MVKSADKMWTQWDVWPLGGVSREQLNNAWAKLNEAYPLANLEEAMKNMKHYWVSKLLEQAQNEGKGSSFLNRMLDAWITADNLASSINWIKCDCLRIGKERYAFNRIWPVKIDDGIEFRDFEAFYNFFVRELKRASN